MMKHKTMSLKRKQAITGYMFLAPIILGLVFIFIPSVMRAFQYTVNEISMGENGIELTPVGWKYYEQALLVDTSATYLLNSVKQVLVQVPIVLIFSFFIANILNQRFKGRTFYRAVFFLPVIATAGVVGLFEQHDTLIGMYTAGGKLDAGLTTEVIYGYESLKNMLQNSQLNQTLVNIVIGAIDGLYTVVTSSGVQMLIFLSGLQSIPESLYEAAHVEGANGWICFWKISLPMISPLILVNYVYSLVDSFLSHNNEAMEYIGVFLYTNVKYSYAITLSFIYLAIISVILLISFLLINRMVIYKD